MGGGHYDGRRLNFSLTNGKKLIIVEILKKLQFLLKKHFSGVHTFFITPGYDNGKETGNGGNTDG